MRGGEALEVSSSSSSGSSAVAVGGAKSMATGVV